MKGVLCLSYFKFLIKTAMLHSVATSNYNYNALSLKVQSMGSDQWFGGKIHWSLFGLKPKFDLFQLLLFEYASLDCNLILSIQKILKSLVLLLQCSPAVFTDPSPPQLAQFPSTLAYS